MTDAPKLHFAVVATDIALFTLKEGELLVRVIRVNRPPHYVNAIALPGGLLSPLETAEEAAARHIKDKTGIDPAKLHLEQLYTFSALNRDKRGRVVSVAHIAFVPWESLSDAERKDGEDSWWKTVEKAGTLAYDHTDMLETALTRLRSRVRYTTLIQKLLPAEFTLTELEKAYESIIGKDLDKRNFRKKILKIGILKELAKKRTGGKFRPAQLYKFASKTVRDIEVI
ncbi:MAG: putative nudix-like regulator [Parcubacteria bacterium C7867-001]|nr:MAG: putative nudix-like regulator [Parcubacteria bacterium C7867-001]